MKYMGAAALLPTLDSPRDDELKRLKRQGVTILKQNRFDLAFFVSDSVSPLKCLLHLLVAREERNIVEPNHVVNEDRVDAGEDDGCYHGGGEHFGQ